MTDPDLLVIMAVAGSKRRQAVQIDLALEGIFIPIDLIVVTPEDVQKHHKTAGTIISEAMREGTVPYERAARWFAEPVCSDALRHYLLLFSQAHTTN